MFRAKITELSLSGTGICGPERFNQYDLIALAAEAAICLDWQVCRAGNDRFVARTDSGWFRWSARIEVTIETSANTDSHGAYNPQLIISAKRKKAAEKLIGMIREICSLLPQEEPGETIAHYHTSYDRIKASTGEAAPAEEAGFFFRILSLFKPGPEYYVTPLLLLMNVGLFTGMIINAVTAPEGTFNPDDILRAWGADDRYATWSGQWWRILSSKFVHLNLYHLTSNMVGLVYVGNLLERFIGPKKFLGAFLWATLFASLASRFLGEGLLHLGASGALFGLFGVFFALMHRMIRSNRAQRPHFTIPIILLTYGYFNGILFNRSDIETPYQINLIAHTTGLISGFLLGLIYGRSIRKGGSRLVKMASYFSVTTALLVVLLSTSVYLYHRSQQGYFKESVPPIGPIMLSIVDNSDDSFDDKREFYLDKLEHFSAIEAMALEVFNLHRKTAEQTILYELGDRGIYYWNRSLQLINELGDSDLPDEIVEMVKTMEAYCQVRIKSYELLYKLVAGKSDGYDSEIARYNQQMRQLMRDFMVSRQNGVPLLLDDTPLMPFITSAASTPPPYQPGDTNSHNYNIGELYHECGLAPLVSFDLFNLAMIGYGRISNLPKENIITIIDFSKPSVEERLFVIDLENRKVLFKSLVAHGKNSGENMATSFSNVSASLKSCLGFLVTAETYIGRHGYSLRLDGLEPGINDNARTRAIVIHGADYVSEEFAKRHGRLGRSWGCPALPRATTKEIIDTIANGSCIFIWSDDQEYVSASKLLNGK